MLHRCVALKLLQVPWLDHLLPRAHPSPSMISPHPPPLNVTATPMKDENAQSGASATTISTAIVAANLNAVSAIIR